MGIPEPTNLPHATEMFPYVFVTDEAFALNRNFMKLYSQTALVDKRHRFNYRLSLARRIDENTLEILVTKFGILQNGK
jgi:hypothetical protein